MNMREARIEAQKRWGRFGAVRKDRYKRNNPFWVGINTWDSFGQQFKLYGSGNSWEDAFNQATTRKAWEQKG